MWGGRERTEGPPRRGRVRAPPGPATLAESYANLCQTGRLVFYGFHSMLPSATALNPLAWLSMARGVFAMPKFEPMDMTLSSKSAAGFNLSVSRVRAPRGSRGARRSRRVRDRRSRVLPRSFFAEETDLVDAYFKQLLEWVDQGKLKAPKVTTFAFEDLPQAHVLIQSGRSVGKLVCATGADVAGALGPG